MVSETLHYENARFAQSLRRREDFSVAQPHVEDRARQFGLVAVQMRQHILDADIGAIDLIAAILDDGLEIQRDEELVLDQQNGFSHARAPSPAR